MKIEASALGLCAALAAGAVQAQAPAGMKPGLWEMRIVKMEQDGQDMLAMMRQAMASIPPEQRKRMGGSGDGTVSRVCYSAEMLKGNAWLAVPSAQKADCSPPKVSSSGSSATFEVTCKGSESKGEYVAAGDQFTMKVQTVMTAGGRHTMAQEMQMKFLGGDCGDVKPLDQIAREMQAGAAGRPARK